MQVLMPMAGAGSRFTAAGYDVPKPFIRVNGQPMYLGALSDIVPREALPTTKVVCVIQPSMRNYFETTSPGGIVCVETAGLTEGAACSALLAEPYFALDEMLVVCNSDQRLTVDFDADIPPDSIPDAVVLTFPATDSKWSYLTRAADGTITGLVEKPASPPSDLATCGVYVFRTARLFFDAVRAMIAANDRTRGEFYLAPALNHLPKPLKIASFPVAEMHGLGTPEDLRTYLQRPRQ